MNAEKKRLEEASRKAGQSARWKKWGPYVTERQWGTVREDYSANGDAWNYFIHDHARSRAYRWGEDGIGGICDREQHLCYATAFWNGRDPILKERLFGLTGSEANHGEDVKEVYFFQDNTPTHTYMRMTYKYPQAAYPYEQLIAENRRAGRNSPEFELLDTGVFAGDRYFDIILEYAKAEPEEILIRISVTNRGQEEAELYLLPSLWFRNTWGWGYPAGPMQAVHEKPSLRAVTAASIEAVHPRAGKYHLAFENAPELLFTENRPERFEPRHFNNSSHM